MAVAGMNLGKRFGKTPFRQNLVSAKPRGRNAHLALAYASAKQQLNTRDGEVEGRQHEW